MSKQNGLRRSCAALFALLVIGSGLSVGTDAAAEEPDPIAIAQAPIDDAFTRIEQLVQQRPDWTEFYGGASADVEGGLLEVFLTGMAPYEMREAIRQEAGDVRLRIGVSRYNQSELMTQAEVLAAADPNIAGVAVASNGDGLVVDLIESPTARSSDENPYVLEYRTTGPVVPAVATRQNDSSAAPGWKAGARIDSFSCTTGYAVRRNSQDYLITAAHCGLSGRTATDGAGSTIGTTSGRDASDDQMYIAASAAAPRQYDKAYNNSAGLYKNVVGATTSLGGTYVCTSGSYTGVNCDIQITNQNYYYNLTGSMSGNSTYKWGALAFRRTISLRAMGTGDSGGPVLKNTGVLADIRAAGMISGGNREVTCGSGSVAGKCYNRLIYIKIGDLTDGGYALKVR
ncbi:hypothetical protein [Microlunatus speluncae]|uniref:hypothetical protein n=1 Tax=Microlunatus speluncae TaxID=2594267 RepID=UPI00126652B9|nr:hypothetical protein [Microlunatus speluncae]